MGDGRREGPLGDARLRTAARHAVVTVAAALGALESAVQLEHHTGLPSSSPVLAVVLVLVLRRVGRPSLLGAVELCAVALAAAEVGRLLVHERWVGGPLLVVGLTLGTYLRRHGPVLQRAGRLVSLPFIALLVTPLPQLPGHGEPSVLWAPVVAVLALTWSTVASWLLPRAEAVSTTTARASSTGRLPASTRMALQMAVGLSGAYVLGVVLFGDRWTWTLLSAYLVASGNRGRGDVLHKAGLRVLGAGAGTVLATLLGEHLVAGHRTTLVLLFAVLLVALVLRERSYAWWAAGVTAVVALLHDYYGEPAASQLDDRLLGVLLGAVTGLAAAWFVLPVRTEDVFRRRVADCLAALTDALADDAPTAAATSCQHALRQLDQLTPTLRAQRRVRRPPHALDAVLALHELADLPDDPAARRRLRRDVVAVRRSMVGRAEPTELPVPLARVHAVVARPQA